MKTKILFFAILLLDVCIFVGCTRNRKGKNVNDTETVDSISFVSENDSSKQPTAQDTLKKQLLGYWAYEDVTWMRITEDSIYHVDQDGEPAIKYFVSADTITMYYYGFTKKDRFWFIGDSLLFIENKSGDGGVCKYERVR